MTFRRLKQRLNRSNLIETEWRRHPNEGGNAQVYGDTKVSGRAEVRGYSVVSGDYVLN
jgi:hypothetical protein